MQYCLPPPGESQQKTYFFQIRLYTQKWIIDTLTTPNYILRSKQIGAVLSGLAFRHLPPRVLMDGSTKEEQQRGTGRFPEGIQWGDDEKERISNYFQGLSCDCCIQYCLQWVECIWLLWSALLRLHGMNKSLSEQVEMSRPGNYLFLNNMIQESLFKTLVWDPTMDHRYYILGLQLYCTYFVDVLDENFFFSLVTTACQILGP